MIQKIRCLPQLKTLTLLAIMAIQNLGQAPIMVGKLGGEIGVCPVL